MSSDITTDVYSDVYDDILKNVHTLRTVVMYK